MAKGFLLWMPNQFDMIPTLQQFNKLSKEKKYRLLNRVGIKLGVKRYEPGFAIYLLALETYYVEVWLNIQHDIITDAKAFNSYKKLDTFIKGLDISSIYAML